MLQKPRSAWWGQMGRSHRLVRKWDAAEWKTLTADENGEKPQAEMYGGPDETLRISSTHKSFISVMITFPIWENSAAAQQMCLWFPKYLWQHGKTERSELYKIFQITNTKKGENLAGPVSTGTVFRPTLGVLRQCLCGRSFDGQYGFVQCCGFCVLCINVFSSSVSSTDSLSW